ncbi:translocation protein Sec62-domain-containing protein [Limtongia smithiae]|uniref:translocation protein Sec62-domain-containing protein n=1 Tax=Limtongia smithiae TaxID=1125753 RepID=UPI0034CF63FD
MSAAPRTAPVSHAPGATSSPPPSTNAQPLSHPSAGAPGGPPPASPTTLALASFLRHNGALKMRQGVLNGKRADFFRCKRALRALQSPAYVKAQKKKGSLLPPITTEEEAIVAFRALPVSSLAIRVEKLTRKSLATKRAAALAAGGPAGAAAAAKLPPESALSKTKGVPTLVFVREQVVAADDELYYVWIWEQVQLRIYLYAGLGAATVFAIVLFPLWPPIMRLGVWYLSMGLLGLIGLFFVLAIVRLVLFCVTYFATPPGLWIFPNLFADVGFVDSFIPTYAWNVKSEKKKKKGAAVGEEKVTASVSAVVAEDDE